MRYTIYNRLTPKTNYTVIHLCYLLEDQGVAEQFAQSQKICGGPFWTLALMPPSLPALKKRKLSRSSSLVSSIQQLETRLTEAVSSNASLNPLVDLLKIVDDAEDAEDVLKGIYAVYRVFVLMLGSGGYSLGGQGGEGKVVRAWIWERLGGYVDYLVGLLKDDEKALRVGLFYLILLH
jgi:U3 small nucleolar RNA-associated protein 19